MKKRNKTNLWIGLMVGPWMGLNAESVQITTETSGVATIIKIDYLRDDDTLDKEVIQLKKEADHWAIDSKMLLNDSHFNLADPTCARCSVDGMELILRPNGDLFLSGEYAGDLQLNHDGKVIVAKDQSFGVKQNFFLNKAILFENLGAMEVGKTWLCLISGARNSGTLVVKQGWQVMALQNFTNAASGKFTMLRADIISPGTKLTNQGQINCLLDFDGAPCEFTNHAGEVRVGGKATLRVLVNKSEKVPVLGGFREVKRELKDPAGHLIQRGDWRLVFLTTDTAYFDPRKTWNIRPNGYGWGNRDSSLGCVRVITQEQSFTSREGKRASFIVQGSLTVTAPSQCICSHVWAGEFHGDMVNKGYVTMRNLISKKFQNTKKYWYGGPFWGGGGRHVHWDGFVDAGTVTQPTDDRIVSTLEVLGVVTGKVEGFVNNAVDPAQIVVKSTEAVMAQHKATLDAMAAETDIIALFDKEVYEAELQELRANPGAATAVRLQEMRRLKSRSVSDMPSRQGSPKLVE